jgi:hypothetical protein
VKLRGMNRILLVAVALVCIGASTASAASAAPTFTNRMVTVKIAGSQKTTWKATPVADPGCQNKLGGYRGSGTETIEWSHARALKGQLTGSGNSWGLIVNDKRGRPASGLPISGSINRSGGGVSVVCDKDVADTSASCTGRQTFATDAQLAFLTGRRFTADDSKVTLTNSLYPNCNWVWDSLTVRTGAVLLNVGVGKFDPRRLANAKTSVTLATHEEKRCQDEGADPGVECTTVTDWRITFYPAKKRRR